jgi:type I restriction enzyme M protein
MLEQRLWAVCNILRGKMSGDEFKDYILGFIFYKYLSESFFAYATKILEVDGIDFIDLNAEEADDREIIDLVHEAATDSLGYNLFPSQLFRVMAKRCAEEADYFAIDDLQSVFNHIEESARGQQSEDDFVHLFEDLDLSSTKLGKDPARRNALLKEIILKLNEIDFDLSSVDSDVLGDSYEYLISNFASDAGKKAGEFYTPQAVSQILAEAVTMDNENIRSVYDPACGSGSLLLRVARNSGTDKKIGFFGQEMNRTTFNLARMNMILHGVHHRDFQICNDDTLENPMHKGQKFDAIVANPPFSAN